MFQIYKLQKVHVPDLQAPEIKGDKGTSFQFTSEKVTMNIVIWKSLFCLVVFLSTAFTSETTSNSTIEPRSKAGSRGEKRKE